MVSQFKINEFLVSSSPKTCPSLVLSDKQRMIRSLQLCLQHVIIRDTQDRDCFTPSLLSFVDYLENTPDTLFLCQLPSRDVFNIWYVLCLAVHATELSNCEDIIWAYKQFIFYMLLNGVGCDNYLLLKNIMEVFR